jgi:hypothetical protein
MIIAVVMENVLKKERTEVSNAFAMMGKLQQFIKNKNKK